RREGPRPAHRPGARARLASWFRALGVDGHGQVDRQAIRDRAADRPDLALAVVLAEDVVARQADTLQVGHALLVAGGGIDLVADVLRQRDLRRRDPVARAPCRVEARVD